MDIRYIKCLSNRPLLFNRLSELLGVSCDEIKVLYHELSTKAYLSQILSCRPTSIFSQSEPLLYLAVRIVKPSNVVETGVGAGISFTVILQALEDNRFGHLFSIDFRI